LFLRTDKFHWTDLANAARARQGVKVNQKLVSSVTGAGQ